MSNRELPPLGEAKTRYPHINDPIERDQLLALDRQNSAPSDQQTNNGQASDAAMPPNFGIARFAFMQTDQNIAASGNGPQFAYAQRPPIQKFPIPKDDAEYKAQIAAYRQMSEANGISGVKCYDLSGLTDEERKHWQRVQTAASKQRRREQGY